MSGHLISDILLEELFGDDATNARRIVVIRNVGMPDPDVFPELTEVPAPKAARRDPSGMKPWDLARRAAYERADAARAAIAAATGEA